MNHELNNTWTLWLHLQNDTDWSINSYKKVYSFNTLENGIILIENINKEIVEKSMLFFMKDNIKPIWEDPINCDGGCFSYKISIEYVNSVWKQLVYYLIGQTLTDNTELLNSINGISISPKRNFCIIKLWVSNINNLSNNNILQDLSNNNDSLIDPFCIDNLCNIEPQQCIYKKHNVLY